MVLTPKDRASIPPGPAHRVTILHMHAIYSQAQNNTYIKMNLGWKGREGEVLDEVSPSNQLGGLGSAAVSSPSGVQGKAPAT